MLKRTNIPTLGSSVTINEVEWIVCGYKLSENEGDEVRVVLVPGPLGVADSECLQIVPLGAVKAKWEIGYQSAEAESFARELSEFNDGKSDGSNLARFYEHDVWEPRHDRSDIRATVLLPIGSILEIGSARQKHMVIGYYPIYHDIMYDYLITPYPQGMFEFPLFGMINQGEIESVLYQAALSSHERDFLDSLNEIALIRQETNARIIDAITRYQSEHPEETNPLIAPQQLVQGDEYRLE